LGLAASENTSSMAVVESELRQKAVPARPAARAAATSPSAHAILWNAVGATMTGIDMGCPSTVVPRSRGPTPAITR
jgi:hypothetical protein